MKKWNDRSPISYEAACFGLAVIFLCILFLVLLASRAKGEACLVIDVPPAAVIDQPDGDTFHVFSMVPGGKVKIRVHGVDTPEDDEPGFTAAKQFTADWLAKGIFRVTTCGKSTFDRIEGDVKRDGQTLAQALMEAGLTKGARQP